MSDMISNTDNVILKAEDLHYTYDDGTVALNGIDLEIKRGRKTAFLGANGSGKSTFFLCLNGILKPSSGRLFFNGIPFDYSRKGLLQLRSKVGIVFQYPDNQLFSSSVYQEISFGILNLGVSEDEARKQVEQVISELEITPFKEKPTHFLSGGQKKQVAIADILIMSPDVIILDEPSAALDPRHTDIVNQLIDRLTKKGITVIISTHDVDHAYLWADDVVLFHEGKVLMTGSSEQVFTNKSALAKTNLKIPAALELFISMTKKGILSPRLPLPKTLEELEHYIQNLNLSNFTKGVHTMNTNKKKAILVVSFGTSYEDTRKKTIDQIEADIEAAYPDHLIYRAWTSKMIIRKILKRDGIKVFTVSEAMEEMIQDGISEVIIQPTHIINGIENELMKEDALAHRSHFERISFGDPLLTTSEDNTDVIKALMEEFSDLEEKEALIFMGHGTTHYSNSVYAALDYTFKDLGYKNVFLGTVEAYPTIDSIKKLIKSAGISKIRLAPFMVVAGDHATNDMSGDDEDSWKSQLEKDGYEVVTCMRGLGEYQGIRKIYLEHLNKALS